MADGRTGLDLDPPIILSDKGKPRRSARPPCLLLSHSLNRCIRAFAMWSWPVSGLVLAVCAVVLGAATANARETVEEAGLYDCSAVPCAEDNLLVPL